MGIAGAPPVMGEAGSAHPEMKIEIAKILFWQKWSQSALFSHCESVAELRLRLFINRGEGNAAQSPPWMGKFLWGGF